MQDKEYYYQHKDFGLCFTMPGLLWLGYNTSTLKLASHRKSVTWNFIDHPTDGRMKLLPYETLKSAKQSEISNKLRLRMGCKHDDGEACACGDVYNYTSREPIRKMIAKDTKAEAFFLSHRYESVNGTDSLTTGKIKQYTNEASLLNMLLYADKNVKAVVKKGLNLDVEAFYKAIKEIIDLEKTKGNFGDKFPSSYRRLHEKMDTYQKDGYVSLVHGNMGKQNAAKINDEVSTAVLNTFLGDPLQHDDWTILMMYNNWAGRNGYKVIDVSTIGVHRRKKGWLLIRQREGNAALVKTVLKEVNGYRPSQPLFMIEHDDNHIDWLFTDWEDKTQHRHYHRMKSIIVSDSHCDLALGIAYGESLTKETIRAAYVDAMYYMRSLTGGWYLPHEIKSDNWGIAELEPWYKTIGHFYRAGVGSKNRGYIEQMFGSAHFKRCLKIGANNYTGNNITAKNRGVNTEVLNANKKDYPTVQEAPKKIAEFMHRLRHLPLPDGETKEQKWLAAWALMPADKKRPITDEQFLLKFGIEHKPSGRSNSIGTGGIECQIKGVKYRFAVPEDIRVSNIGKSVSIFYDPNDMSRVLVTDNEKLRFVATSPYITPRALADYKTGDRTFLNAILDEKRKTVEQVTNWENNNKQVLKDNGIDASTLLQTNFLIKELRQDADTQAIMINAGEAQETIYDPWEQA